MGVPTRDGPHRWDHDTGKGAVTGTPGDYHDAIHNKLNTVILFLLNIFGGFAPGAVAHLRTLQRRARDAGVEGDRTPYHWSDGGFRRYYSARISAAVVFADARRCRRRLQMLRSQRSHSHVRGRAPLAHA